MVYTSCLSVSWWKVESINTPFKYKGCWESSASYFNVFVHNVRVGCWWNGCRGWTFTLIFWYIFLLCGRWLQRGFPSLQIGKVWFWWVDCLMGKELAAGPSPESGSQWLYVWMENSEDWCSQRVSAGAN